MWRWGVMALYGLLLLVVLAVFRKSLKISYEWWQLTHAVISTLMVLFALIHMFMIGYLFSFAAHEGALGTLHAGPRRTGSVVSNHSTNQRMASAMESNR